MANNSTYFFLVLLFGRYHCFRSQEFDQILDTILFPSVEPPGFTSAILLTAWECTDFHVSLSHAVFCTFGIRNTLWSGQICRTIQLSILYILGVLQRCKAFRPYRMFRLLRLLQNKDATYALIVRFKSSYNVALLVTYYVKW